VNKCHRLNYNQRRISEGKSGASDAVAKEALFEDTASGCAASASGRPQQSLASGSIVEVKI